MADLLSVLSSAQSSLAAQRALTATASHNIDNANTPGYARQTAALEALTPAEQVRGAYIGRGATLTTITQSRDRFLEAQIPQALGGASSSAAQADALEAFHGLDPQATGGLGPAIADFYSSLRALAQNPSDSGLRTSFFGAARTLALTFNRTSQGIESSRTGLDARVSGLTSEIDAEAAAVAKLNGQIQQARASGAEPNDLLDARQTHLDRLAELAGSTPVATSEGYVNVMLPGGVALVAGTRAGSLAAVPDPSNGGHLGLVLTAPGGVGGGPLSGAAVGGSLGGTLSARDGALATAGQRVDQLAYDLAATGSPINVAHAAGYGLDGASGRALFTTVAGPSVTGAAARMALAITDPSQVATAGGTGGVSNGPGDGTNADALLATESSALAGSGKDVQSTLSDVVAQFGSSAASARAFADQDRAIKDQLIGLRESYSGVSIDEEMIAMQRAQRAFEAIAKVIQTADQMMQTLLNLR